MFIVIFRIAQPVSGDTRLDLKGISRLATDVPVKLSKDVQLNRQLANLENVKSKPVVEKEQNVQNENVERVNSDLNVRERIEPNIQENIALGTGSGIQTDNSPKGTTAQSQSPTKRRQLPLDPKTTAQLVVLDTQLRNILKPQREESQASSRSDLKGTAINEGVTKDNDAQEAQGKDVTKAAGVVVDSEIAPVIEGGTKGKVPESEKGHSTKIDVNDIIDNQLNNTEEVKDTVVKKLPDDVEIGMPRATSHSVIFTGIEERSQTQLFGDEAEAQTNLICDDNATRAAPYTIVSQWNAGSLATSSDEDHSEKEVPRLTDFPAPFDSPKFRSIASASAKRRERDPSPFLRRQENLCKDTARRISFDSLLEKKIQQLQSFNAEEVQNRPSIIMSPKKSKSHTNMRIFAEQSDQRKNVSVAELIQTNVKQSEPVQSSPDLLKPAGSFISLKEQGAIQTMTEKNEVLSEKWDSVETGVTPDRPTDLLPKRELGEEANFNEVKPKISTLNDVEIPKNETIDATLPVSGQKEFEKPKQVLVLNGLSAKNDAHLVDMSPSVESPTIKENEIVKTDRNVPILQPQRSISPTSSKKAESKIPVRRRNSSTSDSKEDLNMINATKDSADLKPVTPNSSPKAMLSKSHKYNLSPDLSSKGSIKKYVKSKTSSSFDSKQDSSQPMKCYRSKTFDAHRSGAKVNHNRINTNEKKRLPDLKQRKTPGKSVNVDLPRSKETKNVRELSKSQAEKQQEQALKSLKSKIPRKSMSPSVRTSDTKTRDRRSRKETVDKQTADADAEVSVFTSLGAPLEERGIADGQSPRDMAECDVDNPPEKLDNDYTKMNKTSENTNTINIPNTVSVPDTTEKVDNESEKYKTHVVESFQSLDNQPNLSMSQVRPPDENANKTVSEVKNVLNMQLGEDISHSEASSNRGTGSLSARSETSRASGSGSGKVMPKPPAGHMSRKALAASSTRYLLFMSAC